SCAPPNSPPASAGGAPGRLASSSVDESMKPQPSAPLNTTGPPRTLAGASSFQSDGNAAAHQPPPQAVKPAGTDAGSGSGVRLQPAPTSTRVSSRPIRRTGAHLTRGLRSWGGGAAIARVATPGSGVYLIDR